MTPKKDVTIDEQIGVGAGVDIPAEDAINADLDGESANVDTEAEVPATATDGVAVEQPLALKTHPMNGGTYVKVDGEFIPVTE